MNIMGITCAYGASPVLKNADVAINNHDFVGIVGPNGSGKSTLVRVISRILPPVAGRVMLEEEDIYRIPAAHLAQKMAVLTQEGGLDFPFTVKDVVMMGRIPHIKRFAREGPHDLEAVARAMQLTDTSALADRQAHELSGGEKQRVLLARALAQEPRILILDEPTCYLDINYQIEIMELLARLRRDYGLTIIMVLHDLNLASRYCDYLIVLKAGSIHAVGKPLEIITPVMIREVYGCEVKVEYPGSASCPYIVFQDEESQARRYDRGGWVHVVGGGGAGVVLFRKLCQSGWRVSTGVVNVDDGDWLEALRLGIETIKALPFCAIGAEDSRRNREMMQRAKYVIMAGIPFGPGNVGNLETVLEHAESGAAVIVIDDPDISVRDFTGGQASEIYQRLLGCGVRLVRNEHEAIKLLEGGTLNGS